jgi:hypothetical protein
MQRDIEPQIRALFTAMACSIVAAVPGAGVGYLYAHSDFRSTQLPGVSDYNIAFGAAGASYLISFTAMTMGRRKKTSLDMDRQP